MLLSSYFFLATHCGGRRCALPAAPPHPLLLCNRRPLVPTPLPFAFSISINDFFSYVLLSSYILLSWYIFHNRAPLGTYSYSFCFCHQHQRFGFLCASWYAPPHPLLLCNRRPLLPTLLPFAFSISAPPARVYVLPGAPGYLLLFVLLFPSASRICFPMCFFLRTSFLLRIAGGGAAPSPLHPPTRFYCVTGAPWYLLLFRLLVPSASTNFFSYVLLSSYILLSWYIFHNWPPLVPTPIPFAFAISINDLGSYVLLSLYFFLGTHCGGRRCASLVPSCHEHR